MNLAQLIDPERVQNGIAKEKREARPAPREPLGTVTRTADEITLPSEPNSRPMLPRGYAARLLRKVLGDAAAPMTGRELFERLGDELEMEQVQSGLLQLNASKEAERSGPKGEYRYALTLAGFTVLREESSHAAPPAPAAAARLAPAPPAPRRTISGTVLDVLARAGEPLSALATYERVLAVLGKAGKSSVGWLIGELAKRGYVERAGREWPPVYRITDAGRTRLP